MRSIIDEVFKRVQKRELERLKFCVAFALFEHALKETFPAPSKRVARANWEAFEKSLPDLAENASPKLQGAISYVCNEPPKKQCVQNGRVVFTKATLTGTGNAAICEALRRIRNNLFHGGKQPYTDRDRQLVEAGLEIIEGYVQNSRRVQGAFKHGAGLL